MSPEDDIDDLGPLAATEKKRPRSAERSDLTRQRYDAGLCLRGCGLQRRENGVYCLGTCPLAGKRLSYRAYTGKPAGTGAAARETNNRFFWGKDKGR